jgi:hypothetical protein
MAAWPPRRINMAPVAVRENIKAQIDTLPDEVLASVRDFILFQKNQSLAEKSLTEAEKDEALNALLAFPQRLPSTFDYKQELLGYLDERYDSAN